MDSATDFFLSLFQTPFHGYLQALNGKVFLCTTILLGTKLHSHEFFYFSTLKFHVFFEKYSSQKESMKLESLLFKEDFLSDILKVIKVITLVSSFQSSYLIKLLNKLMT